LVNRPEAIFLTRLAVISGEAAYDLFSHQRDGVLKVAITP
jgi:hypothetical protein